MATSAPSTRSARSGQAPKLRLRRGDTVVVLAGRDRGKRGTVTQLFPRLGKVVVEGVNTRTKHVRSRTKGQAGQRISYQAPLPSSAVAVLCASCDKPARVMYQSTTGVKARICRRCQQLL